MKRDKKYYNKLTSLHVNSDLHEQLLKYAEKHNTHVYILVDDMFKKLLKK